MTVDPEVITRVFKITCFNKATGPDGMSAFLIKPFAEELPPAWHPLFQLSIDSQCDVAAHRRVLMAASMSFHLQFTV